MHRKLQPILFGAALCAAACEPGEIRLVGPDDSSEGGTGIEVRVTLEDSALAEALGWEAGAPDVQAQWAFVHHRRYLFHDAASDSAGVIGFEPEGRGWHWIAAEKEVEVDGVRRILGGGAKTTGSAGLSLRVDDPGTLVISEIYMIGPPLRETGNVDYLGSRYIELFNNSPGVLYLDGMLLGIAYNFWYDTSSLGHHPCSYTEPFRGRVDGHNHRLARLRWDHRSGSALWLRARYGAVGRGESSVTVPLSPQGERTGWCVSMGVTLPGSPARSDR